MVYRIYVEKREGLANEAKALLSDIRSLLQIKSLENLRLLNRYDVENIDEELFDYCTKTVFSEPQLDIVTKELDKDGSNIFAVEYLPGQFDQRADSAAQCIQIISQKERPSVRTAKIYMLYGKLSEDEIKKIKKYVINPVEAREASLDKVVTLKVNYDIPTTVETLNGFISLSDNELKKFVDKYALAMDFDEYKILPVIFPVRKA